MKRSIIILIICCLFTGCSKDQPATPAEAASTKEPEVRLSHLNQICNYYDKEIDDLTKRIEALENQIKILYPEGSPLE